MRDPMDEFYDVADCGHEVYEGGLLLEWDGERLCRDCLIDRLREMDEESLALYLGCGYSVVHRPTEREKNLRYYEEMAEDARYGL
ncbi:MAG: hypothetical protein IKZ82_06320 [Clostridia bacterium]|nr:hypothetical protein [Clostridia bacterium]